MAEKTVEIREEVSSLRLDVKGLDEKVQKLAETDKKHSRAISELRQPWQKAIRQIGASLLLVIAGILASLATNLERRLGIGPEAPANAAPASASGK